MQKEKIYIQSQTGISFLDIKDILYCVAEGNYTKIMMTDNSSYIVSKHLKKIEEQLPAPIFFRCHRSWIINLNHVKEMCRNQKHTLIMNNHEAIKLSVRNIAKFRKTIDLCFNSFKN
ncbi:MAG: hypothetical protein A2W91_19615 [Bacteroidetes bacterium GWF2_38_335]|nr:MAG: hypothetical protein A2W91_19615 [Bacteroidetes bacterium GWF2_38_335]OFY79964.1 MAG: hypothetical protein A2281_11015 [Bacteroidetes bacterium RIFOXYA12_FULL_38_20]HBS86424.1 hypothetical protein [Bacteroidales bacterium]